METTTKHTKSTIGCCRQRIRIQEARRPTVHAAMRRGMPVQLFGQLTRRFRPFAKRTYGSVAGRRQIAAPCSQRVDFLRGREREGERASERTSYLLLSPSLLEAERMESAATAVTEAGARTEAEGRRDGEGTERARRRKENSGEGRTEGRASDGGSERELHGQYLWAQLGSAASEQVRTCMRDTMTVGASAPSSSRLHGGCTVHLLVEGGTCHSNPPPRDCDQVWQRFPPSDRPVVRPCHNLEHRARPRPARSLAPLVVVAGVDVVRDSLSLSLSVAPLRWPLVLVWAECQAINVLFRVTDERKSERTRHGGRKGGRTAMAEWHRIERKEGRKLGVRCEIK